MVACYGNVTLYASLTSFFFSLHNIELLIYMITIHVTFSMHHLVQLKVQPDVRVFFPFIKKKKIICQVVGGLSVSYCDALLLLVLLKYSTRGRQQSCYFKIGLHK